MWVFLEFRLHISAQDTPRHYMQVSGWFESVWQVLWSYNKRNLSSFLRLTRFFLSNVFLYSNVGKKLNSFELFRKPVLSYGSHISTTVSNFYLNILENWKVITNWNYTKIIFNWWHRVWRYFLHSTLPDGLDTRQTLFVGISADTLVYVRLLAQIVAFAMHILWQKL